MSIGNEDLILVSIFKPVTGWISFCFWFLVLGIHEHELGRLREDVQSGVAREFTFTEQSLPWI